MRSETNDSRPTLNVREGCEAPRPGERVRVYRNRNRGGFSIQTRQPGRGWRVVAYAQAGTWTMYGVTPYVNRRGRARAQATGVRNVHAWLEGAWAGPRQSEAPSLALIYSPWNTDGWQISDGFAPWTRAPQRLGSAALLADTGRVRALVQ